MMMTTGVVMVAYGGAMKGQWEEKLWVNEKKNEEGEETEKNRERDVTWWDKSYGWVPFFA